MRDIFSEEGIKLALIGECVGHFSAAGVIGARTCVLTCAFYNVYEIVAPNLVYKVMRRVGDRIIDRLPGRAGIEEPEVRSSGRKALIGKRGMAGVGRAVEKAVHTYPTVWELIPTILGDPQPPC